jgi:hypothetical protein
MSFADAFAEDEAERTPRGFRRPTWREPQGGFVRSESFGGPPVPRGVRLPDDVLIICGLTAKALFSRAVCCALCNTLEVRKSLPPPARQQPPSREVADMLRASRLHDDVLLHPFSDGAEQNLFPLERLGPWTVIASREVRACLIDLRESQAVRDAGSGARLRAVLAAEKAAGLHAEDGPLAPGSAASALCWLVRYLAMWVDLWREPRRPTFKEALDDAYKTEVAPYHGWLLQKGFAFATALVPSWAEARMLLAEHDAEGEAGMLRCVEALRPILDSTRTIMREMRLWDLTVLGER